MEKKETKYTQEFNEQMVAMYKAGKPATELVKEYGMSKSTLHKWIGDYNRTGSFHAKDNLSVEENELIALRKENKQEQLLLCKGRKKIRRSAGKCDHSHFSKRP